MSAWSASWELTRERPGAYALATLAGLALWGATSALVLRARFRGPWAMGVVLVVALAARLVLVPSAPDISGDVNRYVWDGRVQAEGVNPYRYPPDHPRLAALRDDEVWPGINRKPVPTIYPPVAQATFAGLHVAGARSVAAFKLAASLADVAAVVLLALLLARLGMAPERSAIYAWHPLAIVEVGRSGHVDALAVVLLLAALLAHAGRRPIATGALTAGAALVKFYAAVVLPALVWVGGRRRPAVAVAAGATAALAYLPYLGVGTGVLGYLPGYLEEEGFESGGRFHLLELLPGATRDLALGPVAAATWYPALVVAAVGAAAAWMVLRPPATPRDAPTRALLLLTLLVVLSTPTYPWYLLPMAALVPVARPRVAVPAAVTCACAPLLYLQWWLPAAWPLHLTWGAGALALAGSGALALRARRRGPAPRLEPRRA